MSDEHSEIRDLSGLARHVTYWNIAWALIQIALSCFTYLELQELGKWQVDQPVEWGASTLNPDVELYAGITALLFVLIFLVSGVLSLRWIYLANRNAQRLSGGLNVSPGWNVGWFFVPIATWFKPFQGISETWRASQNPSGWNDVETPSLLRWWWAFWLATSMAGTISTRLQWSGGSAGKLILADWFDIASTVLALPAAYFFIKVVTGLTDAQRPFTRG